MDDDPNPHLTQRWQAWFQSQAAGQAVITLEGRFTEVNARFCLHTGYGAQQLIGRHFADITHPEDLPNCLQAVQALLAGQTPYACLDKRYMRPDGTAVWGKASMVLVRTPSGEPDHILGLIEDIDERKRLDASLRERNALLQSLSRNVPGAIIKFRMGLDGQFSLPYVSEGLGALYELDGEELRQDYTRSFARIHPQDLAQIQQMLAQRAEAMQAHAPVPPLPPVFQYRLALPLKGERWVQAATTHECEPDGGVAWYIYLNDVTEQKQYEQAMVQARAAEAANRAKSEFLSRMSHELRTPLNAVIGFAQLLLMDQAQPLSPAQAGKVGLIERAGAHLLAVLSDVLDLSRIEAGDLPLSLQALDVHAVVEDAFGLVSELARRNQVALVCGELCDPAYVRADRVRLREVLVNLLSNAIKYNRVGGQVRCSVMADGGESVHIEVADTGMGMTAQQLEHLFEPFNRLGAEQSGIEGTGIGLVIVRRLVELMSGSITAYSVPARGSRFAITLPAAAQPDTPTPPTARLTQAARTGATPMRVLYAEDNEINVMLVRQILEMRPHCKLIVAGTGAEAIRAARAVRPDLILLDMHLGDMTGFQVAEILDQEPSTAGVPRIALSADAMPDKIHAARAHGFMAYLTKPLDVVTLLRCLDEHLQTS